MTAASNVPRVPGLSSARLRRDHMLTGRPVVIPDLFAGEPIAELSRAGAAAVRARLGDLRLRTRLNYALAVMGETGPADEPATTWEQTLAEYLDYVERHPGTRRCSVEFLTPPEVRRLFSVPPLCRELEVLPDDLLSLLFVANRGNSAHLHFDCDHRHVLLHQVMGTKRVIVIPALVGRKVLPFGSFGGLAIQEMPEDEKTRLVAYLGGSDTLLHPGETLFIPALAWHYVEYVDTGMSVSLRFGRGELDRLVAEQVFHDLYVQNVGTVALRSGLPADLEQRIRGAVARSYPSPAEKYRCLKRLFQDLFQLLCPDAYAGRHAVPDTARLEERLGTSFYQDQARSASGADPWRGTSDVQGVPDEMAHSLVDGLGAPGARERGRALDGSGRGGGGRER
jgi:lysine-specific demethylase 8